MGKTKLYGIKTNILLLRYYEMPLPALVPLICTLRCDQFFGR